MLLVSRVVVNAKRPKKTDSATSVVVVATTESTTRCLLSAPSFSSSPLFLCLLFFVFCLVIPRVAPCDVIGATYCIHKPDKDLKEENLEEYCDKYKEHLECVYSKYKGCDKKEKYVEAMESMIKGLRKKAKQIEVLCEIDIDIPGEETKKVNNSQDVRTGGGGGGGGGGSGGLTRPTRPTTTTTPCKISLISSECHTILPNIQFTPSWTGVQKQKWCNSAGVYSNCLKTRMINCYGSQYAESLAYYEKIQKYIHTQANLNCPGGLEGCIANPNDVRCKMGVKYGETSGDSSILYQSLFMTLFKLFLAVFFIYLYHNYQDFH